MRLRTPIVALGGYLNTYQISNVYIFLPLFFFPLKMFQRVSLFVRVKDDVDIRKGEIPGDLTLLKSTQFQGYPALFKYVFSNFILLFVVKNVIES